MRSYQDDQIIKAQKELIDLLQLQIMDLTMMSLLKL